jgi:hypothetical protein
MTSVLVGQSLLAESMTGFRVVVVNGPPPKREVDLA